MDQLTSARQSAAYPMDEFVNKAETESDGLSVVIPCFNDGRFLEEAVQSVLEGIQRPFEIIIVDDGSVDRETLEILKTLESLESVRVLRQKNAGPAAARNYGISVTSYEAILALDSDNQALPAYLNKAPDLIYSGDFDVVYADALTFGKEIGHWDLSDLDLSLLITKNRIDNCAVFSKRIWHKVRGYPEDRRIGYEDWAFWLEILAGDGRFHYLNEPGFRYRIRDDSIVARFRNNHKKLLEVYENIYSKQMSAANFCVEKGLISHKKGRQLRSEVYANLCYFQLSYGSIIQGYKNWLLAHWLHPKWSQFTRCAFTSPVKRIMQTIGIIGQR